MRKEGREERDKWELSKGEGTNDRWREEERRRKRRFEEGENENGGRVVEEKEGKNKTAK